MYETISNQGTTDHDSFVAALRAAEWQAQLSGTATVVRSDADNGVTVFYGEDECGFGAWSYRSA